MLRPELFARAPLSDVWVSFHDLPKSVVDELWRRIERNDPDGPSPFDDDDLPNVNWLVAEIMARDTRARIRGRGCAGGIAAKLATNPRSDEHMGKRSNFERIPRDFYPTPDAAVPPLIPYLRGVRTFAEPCCGDGALVRHLESFGLRCVYPGDIATGRTPGARHVWRRRRDHHQPALHPRADA